MSKERANHLSKHYNCLAELSERLTSWSHPQLKKNIAVFGADTEQINEKTHEISRKTKWVLLI